MQTAYLLRMPKELKEKVFKEADNKGLSMKALITMILWDYVNKKRIER